MDKTCCNKKRRSQNYIKWVCFQENLVFNPARDKIKQKLPILITCLKSTEIYRKWKIITFRENRSPLWIRQSWWEETPPIWAHLMPLIILKVWMIHFICFRKLNLSLFRLTLLISCRWRITWNKTSIIKVLVIILHLGPHHLRSFKCIIDLNMGRIYRKGNNWAPHKSIN